jgi:hypothetical protein
MRNSTNQFFQGKVKMLKRDLVHQGTKRVGIVMNHQMMTITTIHPTNTRLKIKPTKENKEKIIMMKISLIHQRKRSISQLMMMMTQSMRRKRFKGT